MNEAATKDCPFCAETIKAAAIVCRYCHRDLPVASDQPKVMSLGSELSYESARAHMSQKMWDALVFAGKPKLYMTSEGNVVPDFEPGQKDMVIAHNLGEEYARIWLAAGKPDINKFAQGLENQAQSLSKNTDNTTMEIRILDEPEIRVRASKEQYRVWKKIGKPEIILLNGTDLMYRCQLDFQYKYGRTMPSDVFDLWVWAGKPTLEFWDIQASASMRQQQLAQVAQMQIEQVRQGKLSLMNAISQGIGQVGAAVAQNSRQSNYPNGQVNCGVCGQPIAMLARICPFCHTKRM